MEIPITAKPTVIMVVLFGRICSNAKDKPASATTLCTEVVHRGSGGGGGQKGTACERSSTMVHGLKRVRLRFRRRAGGGADSQPALKEGSVGVGDVQNRPNHPG